MRCHCLLQPEDQHCLSWEFVTGENEISFYLHNLCLIFWFNACLIIKLFSLSTVFTKKFWGLGENFVLNFTSPKPVNWENTFLWSVLLLIAVVYSLSLIWLFCDFMDCRPGISQASILEWIAIFLLQGIFLTQESNPHLLHWQVGSLPLVHQGSLGGIKYTDINNSFNVNVWCSLKTL